MQYPSSPTNTQPMKRELRFGPFLLRRLSLQCPTIHGPTSCTGAVNALQCLVKQTNSLGAVVEFLKGMNG